MGAALGSNLKSLSFRAFYLRPLCSAKTVTDVNFVSLDHPAPVSAQQTRSEERLCTQVLAPRCLQLPAGRPPGEVHVEVERGIPKWYVWGRGGVENAEHSELEGATFLPKSERARDRRRACKSQGKNGQSPAT